MKKLSVVVLVSLLVSMAAYGENWEYDPMDGLLYVNPSLPGYFSGVGIGTQIPQTRLHIKGNHVSQIGLMKLEGNTHAYLALNAKAGYDAGIHFWEGSYRKWHISYENEDSRLRFTNVTLGEEVMTLSNDGNVGIGTTSPSHKLEIYDGPLAINEPDGNPEIRFLENGTSQYTFQYKPINDYFTISEYGVADHFVIKDGGNVGIGVTDPAAILEIKGDYTTTAKIKMDDLHIGPNQGSAAGYTRWYLGYNMYWDGNYNEGNWVGNDQYRSIFINDNEKLRFIVGMPQGQTQWTHSELMDYQKFSVDNQGNGLFAGNIRIGIITDDDGSNPGYGDYLYFSGGDDWSGWNSDNSDPIWMARYNSGSDASQLRINVGDSPSASDKIELGTTSQSGEWAPAMVVRADGNVGIGTTEPQSKLAVNGTITTTEVIVTQDGWSDFVFADNYNLMPLNKLEKHIKVNKSLPGIPTEKEVLKNGVEVGNMQAKLLEKVEELTLYVIKQDKKISELEGKIARLEAEK